MTLCDRFEGLVRERDDRLLTREEEAFLCEHREYCSSCRRFEALNSTALNMLRSATLDEELNEIHFDRRVIRLTRLDSARAGFEYWSPALLGAAIACVALVAALQLLSQPATKSPFVPRGQEARLERAAYPALELRNGPIRLR